MGTRARTIVIAALVMGAASLGGIGGGAGPAEGGVTGTGSITIRKDTTPDDLGQAFEFTTTAAPSVTFNIAEGDTFVIHNVAAGQYTITEAALAGWRITAIDCNDADAVVDLVTRTVTLTLAPGEAIDCTLRNTTNGAITIVKDARPDHGQDFAIRALAVAGAFDATLDDDDDPMLPDSVTLDVPPSAYEVHELTPLPPGWTVAGISCDTGEAAQPNDPSVIVVIQPAELVTCTFTNEFRQPDALIRRSFAPGFLGDDVYNADAAGQTTSSELRRLQTQFYDIRIENDGLTDDFVVQGPPGGDGFRVRYLLGRRDVTDLVTGGGLALPGLAEHEARELRLVIRVKHNAAIGSIQDVLVTVASATGVDAVRAQVTVVPWFGHLG